MFLQFPAMLFFIRWLNYIDFLCVRIKRFIIHILKLQNYDRYYSAISTTGGAGYSNIGTKSYNETGYTELCSHRFPGIGQEIERLVLMSF